MRILRPAGTLGRPAAVAQPGCDRCGPSGKIHAALGVVRELRDERIDGDHTVELRFDLRIGLEKRKKKISKFKISN